MDIGNSTVADTAPTGSATVLILDTFAALGGARLDLYQIERYTFAVANNQTGTIQISGSKTGVAGSYDVVTQKAVGVPIAPLALSGPYDFPVTGINYLKVEWINGGVTQTLWRLTQRLIERQRAAQV